MPVAVQRAEIEKVMRSIPLRYDGSDVDLDQPFRPRQRRHDDAVRHRMDPFQPFADDAVDRLAIARIDEVDRDLADVLQPGAPLPPAAS